MTQNGFYVTLPCNASAQVYPKNQIWNYRTKLAKAIVLSEPHEVGLVEFQYQRVWYSFPKTDAVVKVYNGKNRVATILGFKDGEAFPLPTIDRSYTTPYPADIHAGCYTLYIYGDIVDYQLLGDSHVPLLRCINVADEQRRIPTLTYDRPQYTSLSKNVIDDLEISIKNDQNGYITFLYGKVKGSYISDL